VRQCVRYYREVQKDWTPEERTACAGPIQTLMLRSSTMRRTRMTEEQQQKGLARNLEAIQQCIRNYHERQESEAEAARKEEEKQRQRAEFASALAALRADGPANQLAWSAALCRGQSDRAEAMDEIAKQKKYSRIGGVVDLKERRNCKIRSAMPTRGLQRPDRSWRDCAPCRARPPRWSNWQTVSTSARATERSRGSASTWPFLTNSLAPRRLALSPSVDIPLPCVRPTIPGRAWSQPSLRPVSGRGIASRLVERLATNFTNGFENLAIHGERQPRPELIEHYPLLPLECPAR